MTVKFLLDMLMPKAPLLRRDQINEAEKFYLYHQAQAERHAVLAAMYKAQATRLIGEIEEMRIDGDTTLSLHTKGAPGPIAIRPALYPAAPPKKP